MPNRLASQTSPYLLQHAENPVDWYPWGKEALARAAAENRPVLLSIGYSACHWCHVMAHESFEDAATAKLMNDHFVCIKVDREEMPDVDQLYQQALHLQGENGGWPLTMFLTPAGAPFFGGTYFPLHDSHGRPSFKRLLRALADAYQREPATITERAAEYTNGLRHLQENGRGAPVPLTPEILPALQSAAIRLSLQVDREKGGFGKAPKFPNPKALELLLRASRRARLRADSAELELKQGVMITLEKMAEGGMYDQIGGGFARYSTDGDWLLPHFEKMLYDNAQLLSLYAEAYQLAPQALFARTLLQTAAYIERDLRSPEGGLYTAQDADSDDGTGHKQEGRYYVWTWAELGAVLSPDELALCERRLGVKKEGNFVDPHGHAPAAANIFHITGTATQQEALALDEIRQKLLAARAKRIPPGTDDKILASINGLAIVGLATAGRVIKSEALLAAARRTAEFVLAKMRFADGSLARTYKAGEARLQGTLEDHAFVVAGLIALHQATGEGDWLSAAFSLNQICVDRFYDADRRCFYVAQAGEPLIERPVSTFDNATPSGMSVTLHNLIRLGDLTGNTRWQAVAEEVLQVYAERAIENPFGFSHLLNALELFVAGPTTVVLCGDDTTQLRAAVDAVYNPLVTVVDATDAPEELAALLLGKSPAGEARAYVCRNFACEAPVTTPPALRAALQR